MAHITRTSISTTDLRVGDDVIHPVHGRFRVASVEDGGFWWTVTTDTGRELKVSPYQLFSRMTTTTKR